MRQIPLTAAESEQDTLMRGNCGTRNRNIPVLDLARLSKGDFQNLCFKMEILF